jgi:hypothetical protein
MPLKRIKIPLKPDDMFKLIRFFNSRQEELFLSYRNLLLQLQDDLDISSGPIDLDDLADVNAPTPSIGQILQWNGTQWISATVGAAAWGSIGTGTGVGSQADLVAYLLANYQPIGSYVPSTRTLTINGTTFDLSANRSWTISSGVTSVNGQTGVVLLALDDITNVNAPSPSVGQILQWNGTDWIAATATGTGTVQQVDTGTGLTGGPITVTGTVSLNSKLAPADSLAGNALKFLRVNAGATAVEYATVTSSNLNDTTGILFGGALSATIGGTTFSVTAGIGQIVTQTATIAGVATTVSNVTWSAVTGAAITNIGTSQFTYVLVNSSGTVIQQTTPFTDAQYKTHIIIGILCHINLASVNLVTNSQNVAYEDPHRLVELITSFGPIKKTGLNIGPNGANLRVNRTSGEAFKIGANYITDQFEPDVANISAQTPALLCRVHRNGSGGFIFDVNGGSYYNDIDPSQYDDGSGTLQSVGGSKWTIQRLFFFPNNPADIICYYGVQVYNQFSEARANLEFETFDEAQITTENAVFLGFLFVRNAATNLSLTTQATFLQSGLFRGIPPGGGGSGGGGNSIGQLTSPGDVTTVAATAPSQGLTATLAPNYKLGSCTAIFDGAGGVITANTVAYGQVPYNGLITAWTIVSSPAAVGTCTVTAFKAAVYPPTTPTNNIFSVQPALTGTSFNQDTSPAFLAGQDVVTAGDWIGFRITVPVTVTWVNLTLSITKTL